MRILALLFLLISFSFIGIQAQTIEEQLKKFEKPNGYMVFYDKSKDKTSVVSPLVDLEESGKRKHPILSFRLYMRFAGKQPTGDVFYSLMFVTVGNEARFATNIEAIVKIGDEQIGLGIGEYKGGFKQTFGQSLFVESIIYNLSHDQLAQFGKASKIELRIGQQDGHLDESGFRVFRNFSSLLKK